MRAIALVLLAWIMVACCAPPLPPKPAAPADKTEVRMWRELALTVHADTAFTPEQRGAIVQGADSWGPFTRGRIRYHVVFDLDYASLEGLRAHMRENHVTISGVQSWFSMVDEVDRVLGSPETKPIAWTSDESRVFLILDRVEPHHLRQVVMHELGHIAGLPDLPVRGAIMSGTQSLFDVPDFFMPADEAAVRAAGYTETL